MRRLSWKASLVRPNVVTASILLFAMCGFAQVGAPPPPSTRATPLPLSGRNGQSGEVDTTESPVPSTTTSVNTLNPTISVSGVYSGSANSTAAIPFSGKLSLAEAIRRGLAYNLGAIGMAQAMHQVRGLARVARSALLPNISGDVSDTEETFNLQSIGINFSSPGFALPSVVGPFNVMDLRGRLSQSIADFTAINNYRSAQQVVRASDFSAKDARELVVLAVAGSYLQVIAAGARVESARTQLFTANTLYQQNVQQLEFGKVAQLDVNRSHVEVLVEQQRLTTLQNQLAKQKIALARLTGLPPNNQYEISNVVPYAPAPPISLDDTIKKAFEQRADLKAAKVQVAAAERALVAARSERLPSASVSADYGEIGGVSQLQRTYTVVTTLSVPVWNGGRTAGDIEQADAALAQRRAELEETKSQVESDVRTAYLDLQSASSQVQVAQENIEVNQQTLSQTRDRFESGVSDNVAVVQSQESVSSAQLDYIDSVFAHNLAKLSLARAIGEASERWMHFLNVQ